MFHIGQKVVCIREVTSFSQGETGPKRGQTYTIRDIVDYSSYGNSGVGLRLEEIVNEARLYNFWGTPLVAECSFCATRFRPVKKTSIDVFLKMLEPSPKQGVDA